MDVWFLLGEVLMLLGAAFIMGALAQRLRQSPIVGYLLAGMILGPILFNRDAMLGVAELGVALLLFSIGLEFSFNRLKSMGTHVLAIGLLQICVTLTIFCVGLMLLYTFSQALVLGAIAALSSTAVVLRVLVDRVEIDSVRGRYALGILLLQDVAVVPMVLLVTILSPQGNVDSILMPLIKTLAATAAMVMVFYLVFFKLMPVIFQSKGLVANRELFALLVIVVALGSTWAAHAMNLSPALGAFLAGMLLGESPFATQIRADIGSIRTLFVTLFFTSVGMLAEPVWLVNHITIVVSALAAVFIGKSIIINTLCRLFKVSDPNTCRDIIRNIRLTSPGTAIIVRGRYHIAINQLKEAGASSVIDEENVVGRMMAHNVLDFLFTAIPYSMACGLAGKQSDIPENGID